MARQATLFRLHYITVRGRPVPAGYPAVASRRRPVNRRLIWCGRWRTAPLGSRRLRPRWHADGRLIKEAIDIIAQELAARLDWPSGRISPDGVPSLVYLWGPRLGIFSAAGVNEIGPCRRIPFTSCKPSRSETAASCPFSRRSVRRRAPPAHWLRVLHRPTSASLPGRERAIPILANGGRRKFWYARASSLTNTRRAAGWSSLGTGGPVTARMLGRHPVGGRAPAAPSGF
jgi:hypothetical protein